MEAQVFVQILSMVGAIGGSAGAIMYKLAKLEGAINGKGKEIADMKEAYDHIATLCPLCPKPTKRQGD